MVRKVRCTNAEAVGPHIAVSESAARSGSPCSMPKSPRDNAPSDRTRSHPSARSAISTRAPRPGEPGLVSDHDRPEPACKSTVTEVPRIVGLVHDPRPKPAPIIAELPRIEARAAPPAPAVDELSVDAELRGVKVRAGARGAGIAALQHVLIVLIVVAGAVAIVRSFVMSPEAPRRPDLGRCTEPPHPEGARCSQACHARHQARDDPDREP